MSKYRVFELIRENDYARPGEWYGGDSYDSGFDFNGGGIRTLHTWPRIWVDVSESVQVIPQRVEKPASPRPELVVEWRDFPDGSAVFQITKQTLRATSSSGTLMWLGGLVRSGAYPNLYESTLYLRGTSPSYDFEKICVGPKDVSRVEGLLGRLQSEEGWDVTINRGGS